MAENSQESNELKEVSAKDILNKIRNGEPVEYDAVIIKGNLDSNDFHMGPTSEEETMVKLRSASSIKIENSKILGFVRFQNIVFQGPISFKNSEFDEVVDFSRSEFKSKIGFEKTIFNRDVYFGYPHQGAIILDDIDFCEAHFRGDAVFYHTFFYKVSLFYKVIFFKDVNFYGSRFRASNFGSARFLGNASFEDVSFDNCTNFRDSKFTTDACFNRCSFNGSGDFSEISFGGYANFSGSEFNGSNEFVKHIEYDEWDDFVRYGYTESDKSSTKIILFKGCAFFGKDTFIGDAAFNAVIFKGPVSFKESQFKSDANFSSAHFCDESRFDECIFNKATKFMKVDFNRIAHFEDVQFCANKDCVTNFIEASFCGIAIFRNANFGSKADFRDARFIEGLDLTHSELERIQIDWKSINNLICDKSIYTKLIKNFKDQARFEEADECYYQFRRRNQDAKRWYYKENALKIKFNWSKLLDHISWITCGYGVRPLNTIILSIFIITFFSLIYCLGIGIKDLQFKENILQSWTYSLYVSIIIFLTNSKGINWISEPYSFVGIVEGVVGWLLMALFLVTFGRIMIR